MQNSAYIKEIFTSIQGEGPYIGFKQLFIRFSKCNLNCEYCDTEFRNDLKEYTSEELIDIVNSQENIHSVSLTGGEPLMETDFLLEFLPFVQKKIYLETNGTLAENLKKIIDYTDIISMDIKLASNTKLDDLFLKHQEFIQVATNACKEIFLKVVFDKNITEEEIYKTVGLAKKYNLLIILQPKMNADKLEISPETISSVFNNFNNLYDNVRLIPQVHKFINVQ